MELSHPCITTGKTIALTRWTLSVLRWGFPGVSVVKNQPANAGDARDMDSIPGLGRSSGERNSNSLQYSSLENPMDRGAWQATVHGVTKSQTQLSSDHSVLKINE